MGSSRELRFQTTTQVVEPVDVPEDIVELAFPPAKVLVGLGVADGHGRLQGKARYRL